VRVRANWSVQLAGVFIVIAVSLVTAMLLMQWQLVAIGRAAAQIADELTPKIEHLTTARSEMRHALTSLREVVEEDNRRPQDVEDGLRAADDALADYLALPGHLDDRELRPEFVLARNELSEAVEACLSKAQQRDFAAAKRLFGKVSTAGDRMNADITRAIALDAARSHDVALQIARVHRRSSYVAVLLAGLLVSITIAGATVLRRAVRKHTDLVEAHRALMEARASELELFAGRIAHDIRSPLGVVQLAFDQATSPRADDAARERLSEKGRAAIKRIDRLITGLLAFAVAGARPEEGVHADVEATMTDLAPELRAAARQAGADLEISIDVATPVACNPGVLTSVVSNLALNAIKYLDDAPTKRVAIRATEGRNHVRLEVQDTGPGLAPELVTRVFEPYVRGPSASSAPGIGLGLATVKRVATAHGGSVGVTSTLGAGSTFWIELPKAQGVETPRHDWAARLAHARS